MAKVRTFQNIKWRLAQRLEILWWRNYLSKKTKSEYIKWKQDYWKNFFNEHSIELKGSVLEIGSGPAGCFINYLGSDYTAVDPLYNKYDSELEYFRFSDYPSIEFQNNSFEDFSSKKKFDTIIGFNAINHFRDLEYSIDKIKSLLNENGTIYLSTDCHRSNFLKWIFRILPGDMLHPHQHSSDDYKKLFEKAGLKVESEKVIKSEKIFDYVVYRLNL